MSFFNKFKFLVYSQTHSSKTLRSQVSTNAIMWAMWISIKQEITHSNNNISWGARLEHLDVWIDDWVFHWRTSCWSSDQVLIVRNLIDKQWKEKDWSSSMIRWTKNLRKPLPNFLLTRIRSLLISRKPLRNQLRSHEVIWFNFLNKQQVGTFNLKSLFH